MKKNLAKKITLSILAGAMLMSSSVVWAADPPYPAPDWGNSGFRAVAIGVDSAATTDNSIAIGYGAIATGVRETNAIGSWAKATAEGANAIGVRATATSTDAIAIGSSANASGVGAVAIGNEARAEKDGATAIGDGAYALGKLSSAFGTDSVASHENSVALGANSRTSAANTVSIGFVKDGTTYTRKIQYVTAGVADTDAVNVKQLNDRLAVKANTADVYTKTEANGLLDQKADKATTLEGYGITDAYTKTEIDGMLGGSNNAAIAGINQRLDKTNAKINKVGAGAAALAALHPLEYDPDDKLTFSAGMGNYAGENAAALGAFYRPNEKFMVSLGGTMGNGENMVNLGLSIGLDKPNGFAKLSKRELIQEVNAVKLENQAMKDQLANADERIAKADERIAKLEALVAQLVKK